MPEDILPFFSACYRTPSVSISIDPSNIHNILIGRNRPFNMQYIDGRLIDAVSSKQDSTRAHAGLNNTLFC